VVQGVMDEPCFHQEAPMNGTRAGKLLLVEDEHLLRGLIAQFLSSQGYEVVAAADGQEAVQCFLSLGPFDLVLLDLNLPVLSGVDVCRRIKAEQPFQPVIICSAAILDDHCEALLALEVDQFLTKPYHPLELLRRITCELSRAQSGDVEGLDRDLPEGLWPVDVVQCARQVHPAPGQHAGAGLR
jgi:DNA-binding response OmpR family regulator